MQRSSESFVRARQTGLKEMSILRCSGSSITNTLTSPTNVGRNEPCPCGSSKKYKKCCGKVPKEDLDSHGSPTYG